MAADTCVLSDLEPGKKALVDSFTDFELSLKLLEMGFIPGETIEIIRTAPFGDPIAVAVSGYMLSLRKQEAESVRVRPC